MGPSAAMSGPTAFGTTCTATTRSRRRPFARAALMYSRPSVSSIPARSRHDPERAADDERPRERQQAELGRDRRLLPDHLVDCPLPERVRVAEVERRHRAQERPVALVPRPVEAEVAAL